MSTNPLVIPPPSDISPISSLLTTNDPPEPHEEAIAHQIIDSSKTRILKCDELIKTLNTPTGQLNEVLASLKSRRAEYVSYAQLHRNVVGNIRRLPSDILLEIFFDIVTDRWQHGIWRVIEEKYFPYVMPSPFFKQPPSSKNVISPYLSILTPIFRRLSLTDLCPGFILIHQNQKLSVGIFVLDLGIISDFIKRSSCRLTFLCLPNAYDPPNYPASAVHHLLSLVPDVVDLCLPFSAAFLWTTLTSMPSLVPQLRHLYLAGESGDPTAAEQAIREMTVAVAKGDLPTLETMILRSWGLPLSEMIYPSSNETIYEKLLDQWLDKLWKVLIFLHPAYQSDGQIVDVDYLNHTLSLIESQQDIPPLYLCQGYGEEAIPRVKQILERLPDDLFTHLGWMENEAGEFFVYGQRQGSVRVELDGPREANRFASFAFAEDGRIVV
ncbi:unnamed protein product [Cyclocybe aegerita]|uniref:Uncharacterized protein n=1 Tax=Cyclocybe aegerita TaxID=1973307 RepID=A0A8S0VQP9_CYCAE|nr:unnamed protein product [Cyclocybe aegerita]